ncbi:MAG: acyl-CoA dehydrogenase [Gammaproteobacteria bacterium]|nr:acyl-CoA dehydrogenase [Gammaproteobacteria bacterium]
MTDYIAPVRDMMFTLQELAGLDALNRLPAYAEATPDIAEAVLTEAGKLANGVIAPLNVLGDRVGARVVGDAVVVPDGFKEAYDQYVEGGWPGMALFPEFGGQGLPQIIGASLIEMISSANLAFSLCPVLGHGAAETVEAHASDALKATYLHKMVSGEWTATMNLTEPSAGSDLSELKTKAIPQGDHYLITGQKIFITWGEHPLTNNIVHLVLARLPDAPAGTRGISLFLAPKFLVNADGSLGKRNDLRVVSVEHKMGIHASPTCIMSFGDNGGAVGYLIGKENAGLACMFTMMNHARLSVGLQGIGVAERAYQSAVAYAKERRQGRVPGVEGQVSIIKHPDVRRMLMTMRALTEASRSLAYVAAASLDFAHHADDEKTKVFHQARVDLLTPIVKGWATEIAQEVTYWGVQVHGGMGFVEETGAAQYSRDVRITAIYEGTNAIQAADLIRRKIFMDKAQAVNQLLDDMQKTVTDLAQAGSSFAATHTALKKGVEELQAGVQWVIQNFEKDPAAMGNGGWNFLMLMGTVTGGWLLAKAALIAEQKMPNDNYAKTKKITARFYADQIMPRANAYLAAAQAGAESVMAFTESDF